MNREEILNKYIDLIDKGYCCACNELNCIDNFPHAKITHAIKELQQENKKLKEVIDKVIKYISSNDIEVLKYHDIPSETTSYEIVTIDLLKILRGGENE